MEQVVSQNVKWLVTQPAQVVYLVFFIVGGWVFLKTLKIVANYYMRQYDNLIDDYKQYRDKHDRLLEETINCHAETIGKASEVMSQCTEELRRIRLGRGSGSVGGLYPSLPSQHPSSSSEPG
jgi:hypothetical protein